jgi:hypothetical protein
MVWIVFLVFLTSYALADVEIPDLQRIEHSPEIFETLWSKKVEVFSNDGAEYSNIPMLVDVPENLVDIVLYKEFVDGTQQRVSEKLEYEFQRLDKDNDGLTDHLSWIVPEVTANKFLIEGKIGSLDIEVIDEIPQTTTSVVTSSTRTDIKTNIDTTIISVEVLSTVPTTSQIQPTQSTSTTVNEEVEPISTTTSLPEQKETTSTTQESTTTVSTSSTLMETTVHTTSTMDSTSTIFTSTLGTTIDESSTTTQPTQTTSTTVNEEVEPMVEVV